MPGQRSRKSLIAVPVEIVLLEQRAGRGAFGDLGAQPVGQVGLGRNAAVERVAAHHSGQPARMAQHVERVARVELERRAEAVALDIFAVGRHRHVERDEQRLAAEVVGPRDHRVRERAVLPVVELEPQPAAGDRDLLEVHRAGARDGERHPGGRGGAGEREIALVPQQPRGPGRRERERQRARLAEDLGAGVDRLDAAQHARAEGHALEAARLRAMPVSSSVPRSGYSQIPRGSRRRARSRKSAML